MSKITQEEAENRAIKHGFVLIDRYVNMVSINTFICGKCNKQFKIVCQDILYGRNKSCGCQQFSKHRGSLLNKKFGKLKVIEYIGAKERFINGKKTASYGKWKCICDCGKEKNTTTRLLISGKTTSCGNCKIFKNGIPTSNQALQIHKIIGKGIHNYRTKYGPVIDIALVSNNTKIAIEYDGWYWHKKNEKVDRDRKEKLLKNGWKILLIRSRRKIPNSDVILNTIKELSFSSKTEIIITLDDWGKE